MTPHPVPAVPAAAASSSAAAGEPADLRSSPRCRHDYQPSGEGEWTEQDKPTLVWHCIRCDHETREEAERHHWRHEIAQVRLRKLDLDRIRERERCDWPGCPNWEDYQAHWPGGYRVDSLCTAHATLETVVELHPFEPGISSIHS